MITGEVSNAVNFNQTQCLAKWLTIPTLNDTCWFTAILMCLFTSDLMSTVLTHSITSHLLDNDEHRRKKGRHVSEYLGKLSKVIRNGVVHGYLDTYARIFKDLKPEEILMDLLRMNSERYCVNPHIQRGYYVECYLYALLNHFNMSYVCVYKHGNKLHFAPYMYMSKVTEMIKLVDELKKVHTYPHITQHNVIDQMLNQNTHKHILARKSEFEKSTYEPPDVLVMAQNQPIGNGNFLENNSYTPGRSYIKHGQNKDAIQAHITFVNQEYVLDSAIFINVHSPAQSLKHAIAGVTCGGLPYIFNGWTTKAQSKIQGVVDKPCGLLPIAWKDERIKDYYVGVSAYDHFNKQRHCVFEYHQKDTRVHALVKTKRDGEFVYDLSDGYCILLYVKKKTIETIQDRLKKSQSSNTTHWAQSSNSTQYTTRMVPVTGKRSYDKHVPKVTIKVIKKQKSKQKTMKKSAKYKSDKLNKWQLYWNTRPDDPMNIS